MILTCVSLLLGFLPPSQGEQAKGAAPQIMTAQVNKAGRAFILATTYRTVAMEVQVKVPVNGKEEIRKKVVQQHVPVVEEIFLDSPGVEIFGVDGNRLDGKTLKLQNATPVLVSSDGKRIDPFYARIAREGTLLIVDPRLARPMALVMPRPPAEEIKVPKKQ